MIQTIQTETIPQRVQALCARVLREKRETGHVHAEADNTASMYAVRVLSSAVFHLRGQAFKRPYMDYERRELLQTADEMFEFIRANF